MNRMPPRNFSSQPDAGLLEVLGAAQPMCLAAVVLVAGTALAAGWMPALARALPGGGPEMPLTSALGFLISAASLWLSLPLRDASSQNASRALALIAIALGAAVVLEYLSHGGISVHDWASMIATFAHAERMSPQTASALTLLGAVMLLVRARKGALSLVADALSLLLGLLILVILSGYVFGAIRMFGQSMLNRTSPESLVCLTLLNFVAFTRRAEYGVFSIVLGIGIGSRIARIAMPAAVVVPFLLEIVRVEAGTSGAVHPETASALATSLVSFLVFCLTMVMAWRINALEREVRDLSLQDELTGLYNRRGFYLLGQQALRAARRSGKPCSVLFVDVDGLKAVNDRFGHDIGSEFLKEVAELLKATYRDVDIVGRIGGDEFAVFSDFNGAGMPGIADRLERAAAQVNASGQRRYPLAFSIGQAICQPSEQMTLDGLLAIADSRMYAAKRAKKAGRAADLLAPAGAQAD